MPRYFGKDAFEHGTAAKIGVLLCNLGTPTAPTAPALRRYLAQFLSDPRVVEVPRAIWLPILHGIILRTRPAKSARAYAEIWTDDGSPLMSISKRLVAAVGSRLEQRFGEVVQVELGMRYGQPAIGAALERLTAANARRILVLPLYPQYASATTGSVMDAVGVTLKSWRWVPDLRFVSEYHADDGYITALATSVREYRHEHGAGEMLLMSFHGVPREFFLAGDPYHCHCHATARRLAEALGLAEDEWCLSFQSRFGPKEWLRPYTDETLENLGRDGVKRVDVISPGFAADCVETLEEIALQGNETFVAAGGTSLNYIPALNDGAEHVEALAGIIERNLQGWPEIAAAGSGAATAEQRAAARDRALAMGAER